MPVAHITHITHKQTDLSDLPSLAKPTLATSPSLAPNLSSQAKKVYEIEQTDISASQYAYHDRGYVHEFQANTA